MGFSSLYLTAAVPFAAAMLVVARLFPRPVTKVWLLFWVAAALVTGAQLTVSVLPGPGPAMLTAMGAFFVAFGAELAYLRSGVGALADRSFRPRSVVGGLGVGLVTAVVGLSAFAALQAALPGEAPLQLVRVASGSVLLWITFEGMLLSRSAASRPLGFRVVLVGTFVWGVRNLLEPMSALLGFHATGPESPVPGLISLTSMTLIGVGSILGVLSVERDVALEHQRTLMRAERLESLGRMAAGVAHDFNNILGVLSMSLGLVRESVVRGGQEEDFVPALDAVARGRDMVGQLLTFARQGPGGAARVAVSERLRASHPLLARAAGSRCRLRVVESPDPDPVFIDPASLDRVFLNLVMNAADAMPGGGTITVSVASRKLSAPARVGERTLANGPWHVVSVTDTGVGVSESVRDTLFDPFVTTKPGGTGLGLATVGSIVREAGGSVHVATCQGGTTFEVWLPAAAPDVVRPEV